MNFSGTQDIIETIIRDTAAELGYLIYESSVLIKGELSQLIIKIDHPEGISHNDCAVFTKEMTKRLDSQNIFPNYSMEISSPGLSRKVRTIDEFIRFIGSPVKVIYESEGKTNVVKGIINNIIDTKIELKSDNNAIIIDFENIKKANLEY
ncbi:MAG: ribosome maturation factor [Spirochaetes bacterium]|nr:ribosome maturation factor [Spirochaetota bacterium]